MISKEMLDLGSKRSAIRELFEYGKQKAKLVGKENYHLAQQFISLITQF